MTLSIHRKLLLLLLLPILSTGFVVSPVFAIQFNGFWAYEQRGGDEVETIRQFAQRYTFGTGTSLDYSIQPTNAISLSANLGYTIRQTNSFNQNFSQQTGERKTVTQHVLLPSVRAGLFNDIFTANISASSDIRHTQSVTRSEPSWFANLASQWDIPLLPRLKFSLSEISAPGNDFTVFRTEGRKTNSSRFELNWDLILMDLHYNFNRTERQDDLIGNFAQTDSHFLKLQTSGGFWKRKIRYNLSHQYRQSSSDVVSVIESDSSLFVFPLEGQTLSSLTDPATLPDPEPDEFWPDEDIALNFNSDLGDTNYENIALTIADGKRGHFAIDLDFFEQIDILRLTLEPLSTLSEEQAAIMQWDLYVRNLSGSGWVLETEDIGSYDVITKQFELTIDRIDTEIMVAVVNSSGIDLEFTELEALTQQFSDTYESTQTNHLTSFNVSYQIFKSLSFNNSLTLEHFESSSDNSGFENDKRLFSSTLNWRPTSYLNPTFRFSESLDENTASADRKNLIYSFTLPILYNVIRTNFNYSHTDQFTGDQKILNSDNYSLRSTLPIYPDLDGSWSLEYRDSETLQEEGSSYSSRSSISGRLDLFAKLNRNLIADLNTRYTNSKSDTDSNQTANAVLSMRYRPSDILGINADYSRFFLDTDSPATYGLSLEYNIVRTLNNRITLTYNFSQSNSTFHGFSLIGSWAISKHFHLKTSGAYRHKDTASYIFSARLSYHQ